jgi:hypothetical protein
MLVTKGKDVRPHDSGECSIRGPRRTPGKPRSNDGGRGYGTPQ